MVTHVHQDHAGYVKDIMANGIKVLALPDVLNAQPPRYAALGKEAQPMHGYKVGSFKVFALPVEHDVSCLAYVIEHPEMGKTLFATDTMTFEWDIKGLNHIIIEANYADAILDANIEDGIVDKGQRERLLASHMELGTTVSVLKRLDLSETSDITLIHLSSRNSDPVMFRDTVTAATGKPTDVAKAGKRINIDKEPY